MGDLVNIKNGANIPAEYAGMFEADSDDLISGASGGFAVVSIRGSKWRIKSGGEETVVTNDEGDPMPTLEVVMIKASPALSKIYYAKSYEEGDAEAPDCYSTDGVKPSADAPNKQSDSCATCPHAVWGSKITPAGKKAKACQDSRRIAVVPAGDVENELYGGPMLLRVPAASLADLATFGKQLKAKGYPYNTIATKLGFDPNASYPKLTFKALRPLSEDELGTIAQHLQSDRLHQVLADDEFAAPAAPAAAPKKEETKTVDVDFEEPAPEAKAKPAKKAAAKKAEPAPEKEEPKSDLDNDLDDILGELDGIG